MRPANNKQQAKEPAVRWMMLLVLFLVRLAMGYQF